METLPIDRFKEYIRLMPTYNYNVASLCRYEANRYKYRILDFKRTKLGIFDTITSVTLAIIINWTRYLKYYIGCMIALFLVIILYVPHALFVLGIIAFPLMFIYILILILNDEIEHHEILLYEFCSNDTKIISEKCFRFIGCLSGIEKMEYLYSQFKNKEALDINEETPFIKNMQEWADKRNSNSLMKYKVISTSILNNDSILTI